MKYPPYYISRRTRIGIMILLISAFFIISPLTIFYVAGYNYDWDTGKIITTGVLSVDIEPVDAKIYINDVLMERKTQISLTHLKKIEAPVRLTSLKKGIYNVRIEKEGYHTWEKDMTVLDNQTTYVSEMTLPERHDPETLLTDIEQPQISPTGQYIAYVKDDILHISDIETPLDPLYTATSSMMMEWSPYDDFFIHYTTSTFTLLNPASIKDVKTFDIDTIERLQWVKGSNTPELFIEEGHTIMTLNTREKEVFSNTSSSIWYVDGNNNLWEYDEEKNVLIEDELILQPQKYDTLTDIIDINNTRIIAKYGEKTIILHEYMKDDPLKQSIITHNLKYIPSRDEWLTWSPWELWILPEKGSAKLSMRTSEYIRDVDLLYKEGLLLVATDKRLAAFNPNPWYYTLQELLSVESVTDVMVNQKEEMIYFLTEDSSLSKLQY